VGHDGLDKWHQHVAVFGVQHQQVAGWGVHDLSNGAQRGAIRPHRNQALKLVVVELLGIGQIRQFSSVDAQRAATQLGRRLPIGYPGESHEQGAPMGASSLDNEGTTDVTTQLRASGESLFGKVSTQLHRDFPAQPVWPADPADDPLGIPARGVPARRVSARLHGRRFQLPRSAVGVDDVNANPTAADTAYHRA
jgi:hypothetical protein